MKAIHQEIVDRIKAALQAKTSWGRNELLQLIDRINIEVLNERIGT